MVDYTFIKSKLLDLLSNLTILSRHEAIRFVGTSDLGDKLQVATNALSIINSSKALNDYLTSRYHTKTRVFSYDTLKPEDNTVNESIQLEQLSIRIDSIQKKIDQAIQELLNQLNDDFNHLMFLEPIQLLTHIKFLPKVQENQDLINLIRYKVYSEPPTKVLQGPRTIAHDKIFHPNKSALEIGMVTFDENLENNIEYFWGLSLKEEGAANLCALSVIEYDFMPFEFYYDLITQMWDEIRHANHYLKLSLEIMRSNLEFINDETLKSKIIFFNDSGKLPVIAEFNFYQSILNSSLEERLILMNILTESKAVNSISKRLTNNSFVFKNKQLKATLTFDKNDEINHGRNGYKWLKYLISDSHERKTIIENTELLRGFLIASSIATTRKESLEKTINEILN